MGVIMFTPSHCITSAKLIGLGALTLCASSLPGLAQTAIGKVCAATGMSVVQLTGPVRQTTSTTYKPLARFDFTQGKAGCVLVNATGDFLADINSAVFMNAELDGQQQASPLEVRFSSNEFETRSAAFLFENVPAGKHVVRVQWKSTDQGKIVANANTVIWVHFVP